MQLILPLNPVPASRPRVTRTGHVFYQKTYANFRREAKPVIEAEIKRQGLEGCPIAGPLDINIMFFVKRPKKTALQYPKPDIDNYSKAILDSLNGRLFVDDYQVVLLSAVKAWAQPEEEGRIEIYMEQRNEPE